MGIDIKQLGLRCMLEYENGQKKIVTIFYDKGTLVLRFKTIFGVIWKKSSICPRSENVENVKKLEFSK